MDPAPAGRHVGFEVVHHHAGTADYDEYDDLLVGWVRPAAGGRVRTRRLFAYTTDPVTYAIDAGTGGLATLVGAAHGPQQLDWADLDRRAPSGPREKTLAYRNAGGRILPGSLTFAGGRIGYRTTLGSLVSIDPVTAKAVEGAD